MVVVRHTILKVYKSSDNLFICASVIGGVSEVTPNTKCYILEGGNGTWNTGKRSWETWNTVIDMRHGSIMPFEGGYVAMGQVPEYASFKSKIPIL